MSSKLQAPDDTGILGVNTAFHSLMHQYRPVGESQHLVGNSSTELLFLTTYNVSVGSSDTLSGHVKAANAISCQRLPGIFFFFLGGSFPLFLLSLSIYVLFFFLNVHSGAFQILYTF